MMRMFAYILVFSALTAQSMDKFQKNAWVLLGPYLQQQECSEVTKRGEWDVCLGSQRFGAPNLGRNVTW